jgi:hypothetical protein
MESRSEWGRRQDSTASRSSPPDTLRRALPSVAVAAGVAERVSSALDAECGDGEF